jgi:hypothetical protein
MPLPRQSEIVQKVQEASKNPDFQRKVEEAKRIINSAKDARNTPYHCLKTDAVNNKVWVRLVESGEGWDDVKFGPYREVLAMKTMKKLSMWGDYDEKTRIGDKVSVKGPMGPGYHGIVTKIGSGLNDDWKIWVKDKEDGEVKIAHKMNVTRLSSARDRIALAAVEKQLAGKTTNDGKTLDEVSIELTGKKYRQLPDDSPAQEMVMAEFEERGGSAQQAF